jgi:hypothetical protein
MPRRGCGEETVLCVIAEQCQPWSCRMTITHTWIACFSNTSCPVHTHATFPSCPAAMPSPLFSTIAVRRSLRLALPSASASPTLAWNDIGFVWNDVDGGTVYEVMARWLESWKESALSVY